MNWCTRIAMLGPLGHMNASGTIASLVALPLVYWFHSLTQNQYTYLLYNGILFLLSLAIVRCALTHMKRDDDPSEIVIDEIVGCLLTFCGITLSTQSVVLGFILFRLFDISKIAGCAHAERVGGATGIMLDDVIAAALSNLLLRLIL